MHIRSYLTLTELRTSAKYSSNLELVHEAVPPESWRATLDYITCTCKHTLNTSITTHRRILFTIMTITVGGWSEAQLVTSKILDRHWYKTPMLSTSLQRFNFSYYWFLFWSIWFSSSKCRSAFLPSNIHFLGISVAQRGWKDDCVSAPRETANDA